MRPPGVIGLERADLAEIAVDAATIARLFGTACILDLASCIVEIAPATLRDTIAGLLDCIPDRTTARLSVKQVGERAMVGVHADGVRWDRALSCEVPHDWQSGFVLGAAAVFAEHGGELEAWEGAVTGWLPLSP
jgi:hypothetical protein